MIPISACFPWMDEIHLDTVFIGDLLKAARQIMKWIFMWAILLNSTLLERNMVGKSGCSGHSPDRQADSRMI